MRLSEDTVQMLLSKGDDSSLRGAQAVTMRLAVVRGEAQRARHKSLADAAASTLATGEGTFNRVQAPQHPLLTTEAQRQRSEVLDAAADQLWSQLIVVRKKVDDKKAELAAALTSLKGAQESALCRHLEHHSNQLLQYRDLVTEEYLVGEAFSDMVEPNIKIVMEARLVHKQKQQRQHTNRCRHRAVQDGSTTPGIRKGRVDKRVLSVATPAEQIAQLRLRP